MSKTAVKICLDDNGHALIKSAVTYQSGHIPRVGNHKVEEVEKELVLSDL